MLDRIRLFLLALLSSLLVTAVILQIAYGSQPGVPVTLLPPPTLAPSATPAPLRVHVAGAVVAPAVYALPAGSTIQDALAAAGGTATDAELGFMNIAKLLADGEQVHVSTIGEPTPAPESTGGFPININTATAEQLETLPGVGPAIAQRIIDHRQANGPFESKTDIQDVSGIGPATYADMEELIVAGP